LCNDDQRTSHECERALVVSYMAVIRPRRHRMSRQHPALGSRRCSHLVPNDPASEPTYLPFMLRRHRLSHRVCSISTGSYLYL
jgi:hypothetical protein